MPVQRIFSRNAAWQKLIVLKTNRNKRYRYGQFVVEGVRNINEAVRQGWTVDSWIYAAQGKQSDWASDLVRTVATTVNYALDDELMRELSDKGDTSELCAVVRMRDDQAYSGKRHLAGRLPLLVLFDRPANKGNLGTVIRSCDALGADQIAVIGHGVDPYDPETVSASMGSFFKVPIIRLTDTRSVETWLADWRKDWPMLQTIGTTAHRADPICAVDLCRPTVLVIGNETEGMSRYFYEHCDRLATIPMSNMRSASSLNVACAATVLLYEANRQRQGSEDILEV
jgi:TrmH family RNA methyltransferase